MAVPKLYNISLSELVDCYNAEYYHHRHKKKIFS